MRTYITIVLYTMQACMAWWWCSHNEAPFHSNVWRCAWRSKTLHRSPFVHNIVYWLQIHTTVHGACISFIYIRTRVCAHNTHTHTHTTHSQAKCMNSTSPQQQQQQQPKTVMFCCACVRLYVCQARRLHVSVCVCRLSFNSHCHRYACVMV